MTVSGANLKYVYVIRPNGKLDRLGNGTTATSFTPEENGEHVLVYFAQNSSGLTSLKKFIIVVGETATFASATDNYLVKNGVAQYKIVIPKDASYYEQYAAEELKNFLDKATDASFEIITDNGISYSESSKVLSVGKTSVLSDSGVVIDETLKDDGFILQRCGNSLILCGGGDYGTLFSVYEFLYQQLGFETYDANEIVYNQTKNLKLLDFDFSDNPAIEYRQGGYYVAQFDAEFAAKWRTFAGQGGTLEGDVWYRFPHALFSITGPGKHGTTHPEWFSEGLKQPCFTSEGYKQQFISDLKALILSHIRNNRNTLFYPVGLEDVTDGMCNCVNCTAGKSKYKDSGILVRWTNSVAEEIIRWKNEQGITQDIYIPYLAYYETLVPPTNNGAPIDSTVILNKYSPVIFAPIEAANDRPYTNPLNTKYLQYYRDWEKCSTRVMGYLYTGSFSRAFEWSDTIYAHTENLKVLAESNAMYVLDDSGNSAFQAMAFQQMYGYVYSKLKWNPYVDTNQLIREYMQNYYKDAADYVSAYYYLMKMQVQQTLDEHDATWGFVHTNEGVWLNQGVLEQGYQLLVQARETIQNSDKYTDEQKAIYVERIEREMLTPLYYIFEHYSSSYDKTEYLARLDIMKNLCAKFDLTNANVKLDTTEKGIIYAMTNEEVFAKWEGFKS